MLLVSAQLREVAPLRQALQEADVAGSVACDVRQALDLLEIVRRPDVVLIDLALPQGQGLALAAQLRRQPETASLPLLLLLPPDPDPARLLREAEKAQMLGPFGDEDAQRLVRAVLAGRA
jgi:PleD family two-component response regulator